MPISINDLRREQRTVNFDFLGDQVSVTYRPGAVTPEVEDAMQTAQERERPANGLAEVVSMLLVEWDVLDENGTAIPTDLETCRTLPTEFLSAIVVAIVDDNRAGREDRKNSGGGSARRASSAKSRTGTH
jgi:hypothetical protein